MDVDIDTLTPFLSSFPTEVEESVIDQCSDDVATLRHCALTSRNWLPRCRFHLFSIIRISTQESIYSLCDLLDAHPEWRKLIRSISMAPNRLERRPACLLETFPLQLLSRLPNLRGWTLRNDLSSDRTRNVFHHSTTLLHLQISSPIVSLDLKSLDFATHIGFLRFVTAFPRLKHLRCRTIWFPQKKDRDLASNPRRPDSRGIGKLRLSTLQIDVIPNDVLQKLLECTAPTLESLVITGKQDVEGLLAAPLSRMSRLHSLTLNINTNTGEDWGYIATALKSARISLLVNLGEEHEVPEDDTHFRMIIHSRLSDADSVPLGNLSAIHQTAMGSG